MKKILFLLIAALAAMQLSAAPVDASTAQRKAKSYLTKTLYAGKVMAPAALNPVLLKTEIGDTKMGKPVYYIFNTTTTFLVVAGDDRAEEILMVGDEPLTDINNLAPAMQDILDMYKAEIQFLHENPNIQVTRPSDTPRLTAVTYGPLLTAKWDQEEPYNNLCKFTYNNRTYTCLTGCPATSAAMVMHFWKYPASVGAIASYTSTLGLSSTQTVNYTYPALEATTFDWANMKDTYTTSTTGATADAVATLMRYIGQAEKMMYGTYSAGGSGIYTSDTQKVVNMFKNWGYDNGCAVKYKSDYSDTNWKNLLVNELAAGRPMIYNGVSGSSGHAFNVDGYRDSDSKYHVNFGWSGDGNSWYAMNAFSYGGNTFSSSQQAVIGIMPPGGVSTTPELNVTPSTLTFTGATGGTYTQTLSVSGTNLLSDVTFDVSNSLFTVSPSTLTAAEAMAGATVTVTYKPTSAGTHTGLITVSSAYATTQNITVNGTATSSRIITVDPTSLSFNTEVGQAVTATFFLQGYNLASGTGSGVNLAVSGEGFTISKTYLTRTAAQNGATITVTYNPTTSGNHTGVVTITSNEVEDVTVNLNGTATAAPVITVDPTSLSFSTTVGQAVTKTFTVTGSDLTNNISLSVSGTGYTIDKTSINKNAGTTTVTVTYNPTAAGTHTGTVTLTSNGAASKTVSLSGTATNVPTLTVNPTSLSFNTTVGEAVTKTFTVTGADLTSNITLSVSGTGYTIDKTSIDKSAGTTTVTVTYNPTAAGNHNGTVTITSTGATTKTVSLTGTATAPPTMAVNPTSLSFSTTVGVPVTKTFTVTGANLTNNITLAVSGTGFSIDKTNIDKNAGTTTVTVTYNPTEGGSHTGTVTVSTTGVETQTVSLNGTATTIPTIAVDPSSLSFNAVVGTPVSKTFTVTGTYLTNNIALSVNGAGFSIDKTSIDKNAGTTTVTVTYDPTAAGNHTGTVTLTSNGAATQTVALTGIATEPVRTITATPATLNFTALVGETKTATFTVTGENLTGPLTLTVDNGIYSVEPATISVAEATAGKVVTVTYTPNAFGVTTGTVTISGGGAPAATVTLNGQADLVKYAPVMLPADQLFIGLTKFRADWTDETPEENVSSYTLEVTPKVVEPDAEFLSSVDASNYTNANQGYQAVTLTAPWSGNNVYSGYGAIYFRNATHQSATTDGYIKYTIPAGYENKTFTVKITTANTEYGSGRFAVGSTQTAAVEYSMSTNETHSWLVTGSAGEVITITSPENQYSPDLILIEVYAGDATAAATLMANEAGDENSRLITEITDKFYTVENLAAAGTFLYRVKALYLDGTESEWSNVEEVTLFENAHPYQIGDVNHDGAVNITDVTVLISAVLNSQEVCPICADLNNDGTVNITDVTNLISRVLNSAQMNAILNKR